METRNRELFETKFATLDSNEFLTYSSKAMAESLFKYNEFSTYLLTDFPYKGDRPEFLEAVECQMILKTI